MSERYGSKICMGLVTFKLNQWHGLARDHGQDYCSRAVMRQLLSEAMCFDQDVDSDRLLSMVMTALRFMADKAHVYNRNRLSMRAIHTKSRASTWQTGSSQCILCMCKAAIRMSCARHLQHCWLYWSLNA